MIQSLVSVGLETKLGSDVDERTSFFSSCATAQNEGVVEGLTLEEAEVV